jgi:Phosphofructokinase
MNAAIRAVTRSAPDQGLTVYGVRQGWRGLVDGEFRQLSARVAPAARPRTASARSSNCSPIAPPPATMAANQLRMRFSAQAYVLVGFVRVGTRS